MLLGCVHGLIGPLIEMGLVILAVMPLAYANTAGDDLSRQHSGKLHRLADALRQMEALHRVIATAEHNEFLAAVTDEGMAGIEVVEARINYLAYAPEIAAVMLRRQQADAIISAREKIVEGAVSMVKMALDKLSSEDIVELDDDKKAAMVSNLLVVLCGDDTAQPVVNTGTLNH